MGIVRFVCVGIVGQEIWHILTTAVQRLHGNANVAATPLPNNGMVDMPLKNDYFDLRGLHIPKYRIRDLLNQIDKTEQQARQFLGEAADRPGVMLHFLNHVAALMKETKR